MSQLTFDHYKARKKLKSVETQFEIEKMRVDIDREKHETELINGKSRKKKNCVQ